MSTTDVQLVLVLLPVVDTWQRGLPSVYILSRAIEVGSPSNHPGLQAATRHGVRDPLVRSQVDKTYVGQGSFGPFTGGLDLRGRLQPAELNLGWAEVHISPGVIVFVFYGKK